MRDILLRLDEALATQLLRDLEDEGLRSPQLYNAIGKYLDRHKITINSIEPSEDTTDVFKAALSDYDNVVAMQRAESD